MRLRVDSARVERDLPALMSFEEAQDTVEMVVSHYQDVVVSRETHNTTIADIYGEMHPGVDPAVQIADSGRLIAVLFWNLAVARGVIDPDAASP